MSTFTRDGRAYIAALVKRGFRKLGTGMFSQVLHKPGSDRVIKVNGYAGGIDVWPEYVYHANKRGFGGAEAPRLYALKRYNGFCVAVIERLAYTLADGSDHYKDYGKYEALRERGFELTGMVANHYKRATPFQCFLDDFIQAVMPNMDLHFNNVMVQGDRVVLTDPFTTTTNPSGYMAWVTPITAKLQQLPFEKLWNPLG